MSRDSLVKDHGCATSEGARRHYSSDVPRRWMPMSRVSREEIPGTAGPNHCGKRIAARLRRNVSRLLPCYLAFRRSKRPFTSRREHRHSQPSSSVFSAQHSGPVGTPSLLRMSLRLPVRANCVDVLRKSSWRSCHRQDPRQALAPSRSPHPPHTPASEAIGAGRGRSLPVRLREQEAVPSKRSMV
jgi:hypothetical protein